MPANSGDVRDAGSISMSGRSLEEGMATHSSTHAWRIPWTGAWWATVHRVAKSRTQLKRLSMHTKDEEYLGQEHGSKNGEEI